MISAIDLTKSYIGRQETVVALDHASMTVNSGDFIVVTGHSGAGKSTLLGVIGGLLKPSSGEVLIDGSSLWQLDEPARARFRAERIGFVFQTASVISSLKVIENVLLPQIFLPDCRSADRERAQELIELVGLGPKIRSYPHELSGGEKRRVAIASALMNEPDLLLADEPTGDLDADTERQIMNLLAQINKAGTTIVLVTHNEQLASYANRVFRMDRGRLEEIDT